MYKEASRLNLRFQTNAGPLTVEQLWQLPLAVLDTLVVSLDEAYKNSKGKSFLEKRTTKDKTLKLQFDIALDVLQTKAEEADLLKQAKEDKEHNNKIIALIKEKQDGELKGKSITELEAMLR
mgnify:CR=1 FL=1|jgi:hypothetical protein